MLQRAIVILKVAKARGAERIWYRLQWLLLLLCMGILSTFADLFNSVLRIAFMKTTFATLIVGLTLLLSGCNTVKGVGQDVQKAGSVLENAAKK